MAQKICCGGFELGDGLELNGTTLKIGGELEASSLKQEYYDTSVSIENGQIDIADQNNSTLSIGPNSVIIVDGYGQVANIQGAGITVKYTDGSYQAKLYTDSISLESFIDEITNKVDIYANNENGFPGVRFSSDGAEASLAVDFTNPDDPKLMFNGKEVAFVTA